MSTEIEITYFIHNFSYLKIFKTKVNNNNCFSIRKFNIKKHKNIINNYSITYLNNYEFKNINNFRDIETDFISTFDNEFEINKKLHLYTNSKKESIKLLFIKHISKYIQLIGLDKIKDKLIPFIMMVADEETSILIKTEFLKCFENIIYNSKANINLLSNNYIKFIFEILRYNNNNNINKKCFLNLCNDTNYKNINFSINEDIINLAIYNLSYIIQTLDNEAKLKDNTLSNVNYIEILNITKVKILTFIIEISRIENPIYKLIAVKLIYSMINYLDDYLNENFVIYEIIALMQETIEIKMLIVDCIPRFIRKLSTKIIQNLIIDLIIKNYFESKNWALKQYIINNYNTIILSIIRKFKCINYANTIPSINSDKNSIILNNTCYTSNNNNNNNNNINTKETLIFNLMNLFLNQTYDCNLKLSCIKNLNKILIALDNDTLFKNKHDSNNIYLKIFNYYIELQELVFKEIKAEDKNNNKDMTKIYNIAKYSIETYPLICICYLDNNYSILNKKIINVFQFYIQDLNSILIHNTILTMLPVIMIIYNRRNTISQIKNFINEANNIFINIFTYIKSLLNLKDKNIDNILKNKFLSILINIPNKILKEDLYNIYCSKYNKINLLKLIQNFSNTKEVKNSNNFYILNYNYLNWRNTLESLEDLCNYYFLFDNIKNNSDNHNNNLYQYSYDSISNILYYIIPDILKLIFNKNENNILRFKAARYLSKIINFIIVLYKLDYDEFSYANQCNEYNLNSLSYNNDYNNTISNENLDLSSQKNNDDYDNMQCSLKFNKFEQNKNQYEEIFNLKYKKNCKEENDNFKKNFFSLESNFSLVDKFNSYIVKILDIADKSNTTFNNKIFQIKVMKYIILILNKIYYDNNYQVRMLFPLVSIDIIINNSSLYESYFFKKFEKMIEDDTKEVVYSILECFIFILRSNKYIFNNSLHNNSKYCQFLTFNINFKLQSYWLNQFNSSIDVTSFNKEITNIENNVDYNLEIQNNIILNEFLFLNENIDNIFYTNNRNTISKNFKYTNKNIYVCKKYKWIYNSFATLRLIDKFKNSKYSFIKKELLNYKFDSIIDFN